MFLRVFLPLVIGITVLTLVISYAVTEWLVAKYPSLDVLPFPGVVGVVGLALLSIAGMSLEIYRWIKHNRSDL